MAAVTLVDITHDGKLPSSSRSLQFNLISLPEPGNDDMTSMREYMFIASANNSRSSAPASSSDAANKTPAQKQPYDIYEVQSVLPHSGKYASFFIGSRVISNPELHITTRVDPLFFALAYFQRAMGKNGEAAGQLEKWQPWDQVLGEMPSPILRALNLDPNLNVNGIGGVGQLGHLLDVSDMCGDDLILCKFSEERALKWLVAKFERSVEALRRRLKDTKKKAATRSKELSNMQGGSGAFSSSFTVAEEEPEISSGQGEEKNESIGEIDYSLSKDEEKSVRVGALQLICDYIPTQWKNKLCTKVGMDENDWMGKKKTKSSDEEESNTSGENTKRSRSSWEGAIGQDDADALMQYTVGGSGKSASVITPSDKKDVKNAQSVGLKRLAKVNTKGMKSLTSFFGASKKTKT